MKIGLVGCGRVGVTMFYWLKKNNQVVGVYDINKKRMSQAQKLLNLKKNRSYRLIIKTSEAIFLATPDDCILPAYKRALPYITGTKFIFSFSGLLPAEILPKHTGIHRASVHPFMTFPGIEIPSKKKKYLLFVEGDARAKRVTRKIFQKKRFQIFHIGREEKPIFHLIGVFSSNFIVSLVTAADKMSKKINIDKNLFYKMVMPIMEQTLSNIKRYGVERALSGPIARGDIQTVKEHLRILKSDKNLSNIYKALSLNILKAIKTRKKKGPMKKLLEES